MYNGIMTYKLFIDDERFPPNDGAEWVIARSSQEAIDIVRVRGIPDFISYDHDLGGADTSLRFIWWLIDCYLEGTFDEFPVNYYVHSQNPVGAKNIRELLQGFISVEVEGEDDE